MLRLNSARDKSQDRNRNSLFELQGKEFPCRSPRSGYLFGEILTRMVRLGARNRRPALTSPAQPGVAAARTMRPQITAGSKKRWRMQAPDERRLREGRSEIGAQQVMPTVVIAIRRPDCLPASIAPPQNRASESTILSVQFLNRPALNEETTWAGKRSAGDGGGTVQRA